jgi:hypothetical protein
MRRFPSGSYPEDPADFASGMHPEQFWAIVAATHPEEGFEAQLARLHALLARLPRHAIEAWDELCQEYQGMALAAGHVHALAAELGGDPRDWATWVISRGHDFYRQALRHPDLLRQAAADSADAAFDSFHQVALQVMERHRR